MVVVVMTIWLIVLKPQRVLSFKAVLNTRLWLK